MTRAWTVLLAFAVACGTGSSSELAVKDLEDVIRSVDHFERTFELHRAADVRALDSAPQLEVSGSVGDDWRYEATVGVDGRPFYEEVVLDDARYLRLLDTGRFAGVQALDPGLSAFLGGSWIVDPHGAPRDVDAGGELGPALLSVVRYLETMPELLDQAGSIQVHNTDASYYLPRLDKFPRHGRDGQRFDALPASYDPSFVAQGPADLDRFFLFASVWVRDRRPTRVERFLELSDLRRDEQYADLRTQLAQAQAAGVGAGLGLPSMLSTTSVEQYAERYVVRYPAGGVRIPEPHGAVTVQMAAVLAAVQAAAAAA